jgi:RNase P subunit RPR2
VTTKKIILVTCNHCGTTALPAGLPVADLVHLEHPVDSVVEARRQAHVKGWVHDKMGRDICPACRTFPAQKRTHKILHPGLWLR